MAQSTLHSNRAKWGFSLFIRPIILPGKDKNNARMKKSHPRGESLRSENSRKTAGKSYRRGILNDPGDTPGIASPR